MKFRIVTQSHKLPQRKVKTEI